jgi:hypothetical protein
LWWQGAEAVPQQQAVAVAAAGIAPFHQVLIHKVSMQLLSARVALAGHLMARTAQTEQLLRLLLQPLLAAAADSMVEPTY